MDSLEDFVAGVQTVAGEMFTPAGLGIVAAGVLVIGGIIYALRAGDRRTAARQDTPD